MQEFIAMRTRTKLVFLVVLCVCLVPEFLQAQVPQLLNYQGRLDSSGTAVSGTKSMVFSIYSAATGGTLLWTETQSSVTVTNGVFSVPLGSVTAFPSTLFTGMGDRYLETSVGGTVLSPRFRFTSVAYALRSSAADITGSSQWTTSGSNIYYNLGNVGIGTTSPTQKLSVFGPESNMDGFGAALGLANTAPGGRNWYLRAGATGTSTPTGGFSIGDDIAYRLVIDESGNVGIGTTSPTRIIQTQTAINDYSYSQTNGTIELATFLNGSFNSGMIGTVTNHPFQIYTSNAGPVITFTTGGVNGSVGIGTATPAAKLHVIGSAGNNTGVWSNLSDRRLKTGIEPMQGALSTVKQLQGVTFRWKDPKKDAEYGRVRGLIAQNVEKVLPEWVKTDPDGYKRLEPIGIDVLLIEAIKEQNSIIEKQQKEIEELKAAVKALAAEQRGTEKKLVGELR